jgi:hypothetical protein
MRRCWRHTLLAPHAAGATRCWRHTLLAPHWEQTRAAARQAQVVLLVQDTTDVDVTAHPKTQGLGPIGTGAGAGMLVQSVLASEPATRQVLGLAYHEPFLRHAAPKGESCLCPAAHAGARVAGLAPRDRARGARTSRRALGTGGRPLRRHVGRLYHLCAAGLRLPGARGARSAGPAGRAGGGARSSVHNAAPIARTGPRGTRGARAAGTAPAHRAPGAPRTWRSALVR